MLGIRLVLLESHRTRLGTMEQIEAQLGVAYASQLLTALISFSKEPSSASVEIASYAVAASSAERTSLPVALFASPVTNAAEKTGEVGWITIDSNVSSKSTACPNEALARAAPSALAVPLPNIVASVPGDIDST